MRVLARTSDPVGGATTGVEESGGKAGAAVGARLTVPERVCLGSAAVSLVAAGESIPCLHIKGPTATQALGISRSSSDVDVLVRPCDMSRLCSVMIAAGFEGDLNVTKESWAHSGDLISRDLGVGVDVHQFFPGFGAAPETVFDRLWERRQEVEVAGQPCWTLDRVSHALVVVLHAARNLEGTPKWDEGRHAWATLSDEERRDFTQLAEELGALPVIGTRLPEFKDHTDDRTWARWTALRRGDSLRIWLHRLEDEPTAVGAIGLMGRALLRRIHKRRRYAE